MYILPPSPEAFLNQKTSESRTDSSLSIRSTDEPRTKSGLPLKSFSENQGTFEPSKLRQKRRKLQVQTPEKAQQQQLSGILSTAVSTLNQLTAPEEQTGQLHIKKYASFAQ